PGDQRGRIGAARFEGLARSFSMAAPLILEEENLTLNGINVRDYYAYQIVRGMTSGAETGFGTLNELIEEKAGPGPFQQTVECGIMGMNLLISKPVIWDRFTQDEKEVVAGF
ncbi:DUF2264 domain-containing protein, partial [Clostridioides difficile]|nr:DUF2264 domain-containing protein [Clostridioides difficile]